MEIQPGETIKRGIHLTVMDSKDRVVSDQYSKGKQLFWYKNEQKMWPRCVNEVFNEAPIGVQMYLRCPPGVNGQNHEGSDKDQFFHDFGVVKG